MPLEHPKMCLCIQKQILKVLLFQYFPLMYIQENKNDSLKKLLKKHTVDEKSLVCNNHMTSITCYCTHFKLYEVHFPLLLLKEDTFSQSRVPPQKKMKPLF